MDKSWVMVLKIWYETQGVALKKNNQSRRMLRVLLVCVTVLLHINAHSQSTKLLEACNSIEDKGKRLACLKELSALTGQTSPQNSSLKRLKASFAAIDGSVSAGISYNNYKSMITDPAREVGIFKQENPKIPNQTAELLDSAVRAYNDAEKLWRASIYDSKDAGIFGKILNYRELGLSEIIGRYDLPTSVVLLNDHVDVSRALPMIWKSAAKFAKDAFDSLENEQGTPNPSQSELHQSFIPV